MRLKTGVPRIKLNLRQSKYYVKGKQTKEGDVFFDHKLNFNEHLLKIASKDKKRKNKNFKVIY